MYAEYRFLRCTERTTAFARVGVDAVAWDSTDVVVVERLKAVDTRVGEVSGDGYPDWISAAIEGSRECILYLQKAQTIVGGNAGIVRVVGRLVDTTEHVVRCAAALATWKAIVPEQAFPPLLFEKDHWSINWTTA